MSKLLLFPTTTILLLNIIFNITISAAAWMMAPLSYLRSTSQSVPRKPPPPPQSLFHAKHRDQLSMILRRYNIHDLTDNNNNNIDDDTTKQAFDSKHTPQRIIAANLSDEKGEELNKESSSLLLPFDDEDETTSFLLDLRILLIDNHDSYTYNLYQYISTMTTHPVHVIMNDAYSTYDEFITALEMNTSRIKKNSNNITVNDGNVAPTLLEQYFDCIILSPGPGQPSHSEDMGIGLEIIRRNSNVPILGVCLGHQALGYVYGKEVRLSPCGPVHGLMSSVVFDESTRGCKMHNTNEVLNNDGNTTIPTCQLFRGIPQGFHVVRYHSLVVDFSTETNNDDKSNNNNILSGCDSSSQIEPIAWCNDIINESKDGASESSHGKAIICMALRHKKYPHYGVQFHPESIGTGANGYKILQNFCEFAHQWRFHLGKNKELGMHHRRQVFSRDDDDHNHHPQQAQRHHQQVQTDVQMNHTQVTDTKVDDSIRDSSTDQPSKYRVFIHRVVPSGPSISLPSPKQVFDELYSSRATAFWLDSSTGESCYNYDVDNDDHDELKGCPIVGNSRFSIMGSDDGKLSRKIHYFGREHDVQQRGLRVISALGDENDGMLDEDILSYLRRRLVKESEFIDQADVVTFDTTSDTGYKLCPVNEFNGGTDDGQLPFDYRGGYVGYLGYEVRHDTQCWILEQEGAGCPLSDFDASTSEMRANPKVPTAAFLFADRSLLYDHQVRDWYIIGIAENTKNDGSAVDWSNPLCNSADDVISWTRDMKSKIESIGMHNVIPKQPSRFKKLIEDVAFVPNRSKSQYLSDILRSREEIRNGESYELCVTNQLEAILQYPKRSNKASHEIPYELYSLLRQNNPAPFSAFMNFFEEGTPEHNAAAVSICCSSPERFLSVRKLQQQQRTRTKSLLAPKRQFVVESKPIKGTAARYTGSDIEIESNEQVQQKDSEVAAHLSKSAKDRAENLMIVDLLRNDLGRVCMVGSVHVPKLMQIESYATVHQMVSTVRGTLDGDTSHAIDVIEACFPGGSMTGAPKQRTMDILNEIELGVPRGPYSGCLGYVSLNGAMDMNIIIRTAVLTPEDTSAPQDMDVWKASVGCGGAITALSNSDNEYNEMLLKSQVVRRSLSEWVTQITADHDQNR